jgi:hypothetical protein
MQFKIPMHISRTAEARIFNVHLTHIAGILQTPHMVLFMARLNVRFHTAVN